jgi:hypothetical protein
MFLSARHMRAFKTSGGFNGMYEVSIASNCRPAKNHSVMSQNVLDGLNHNLTIFTLINSHILIDLCFEFFKNQKP